MLGVGVLFFIFGILLILEGIFNCHGHRPNIYVGGYMYKNMTKEELANMGKYIIIIGGCLSIGSISCFFFKEESIIPVIIMGVLLICSIIVYNRLKNYK